MLSAYQAMASTADKLRVGLVRRTPMRRTSSVVASTSPATSLLDAVAYYKLDDVNDSSGNGYTLTNNNAVTFGAGKVGNAASFVAASNQSLSRAGSDLDITTTDYAFSFWFKVATDDKILFSKGADGTLGYSMYVSTGGLLQWNHVASGVGDLNTGTTGVDVSDNAWHHGVVNGDRDGNASIYIDTVLRGSNSIAAATATLAVATAFMLGGFPSPDIELSGSLDEFGFWRRILTASEIAYLYNSGNGVSLF